MKDNSHEVKENSVTEEEHEERVVDAENASDDPQNESTTTEDAGSAGNSDTASDELIQLKETLAKKDLEIAQIKDLMMRRQADFDNYKKRTARQEEMNKRMLIKDIALDIIGINDNLIRASEAAEHVAEGEDLEKAHRSYVEGVLMISKSIEEMLRKYGIEEIDAIGRHFDPNVHEALEISMSEDVKDDTVTKVFQKGFRLDEFVLRSSKVCVTKPQPKMQEQEGTDAGGEKDENAEKQA
ncbi:MAG: nucleotide exchange factor GrpE [Spirochaetota bacterium]